MERAHVDDGGTYDRAPFRIDDPSLDFQRFVGFRCILFFRNKHLFVDDPVGVGRTGEHTVEHFRDRSVAFRYGDAQRGVDQIVVVEKGEFALRFDGFEHVEDRSVRHFDGQPLPLLCMKRCGDAVCCKERHAAKQDPEAFPDVVKVFHKVF